MTAFQTTTTGTRPAPAEQLDRHEERIRAELTRSETKASAVLTAAGVVLSVVAVGLGAAAAVRIPVPVTVAGAAAAAADAAAVVLALLTVKPNLARCQPGGWVRLAGKPGPVVLELLAGDDPHTDQAQQVGYLAALACRKYRYTAAACWLMIVGVILLGAPGVLALVLLAAA
jgi:hypothetical protein